MGITIRERKQRNKEISLYFDIIVNGERTYEFLGLKLKPERTSKDKEHNKEIKELAERIKAQRWNEIINDVHGIEVKKSKKVNFIDFAMKEINSYTISKRNYLGVVKMLKDFVGGETLYTTSINEKFLNHFYDYMETRLTGETPSTYFKKLKRLVKDATKQKLLRENPCVGFKCRKFISKEKPILSFEEIILLLNTPCPNQEVKDAFIFSCLTGVRFGDIKELKGAYIKGNNIEFVQKKTRVKIKGILNDDALKIIENRIKNNELIFRLPSHTSCLKNLRKWLKNAKIDKHIGWHNSRHSFGTNLIAHGADIHTTSKLLGHTSLVYTQRYIRESQSLKEKAVNNLPQIFNK